MRILKGFGFICLIGCQSPRKTSLQFMQELKMGEYDNASLLTIEGKVNAHPHETQTARKAVARLFSKMEYKIIDVVTQNEQATVHVEINNVKTAEILAVVAMETMKQGANDLYNHQKRTYDESFLTGVQNQIEAPDAQLVTTNVHLQLEKQNAEWKITNQKKAIRQMLGL